MRSLLVLLKAVVSFLIGAIAVVATAQPIIYDNFTFNNEPDLGLSQDIGFVYEWEATLDTESPLPEGQKASARTIERQKLKDVINKYAQNYKYIVIDIESLAIDEGYIAQEYLRVAKTATSNAKVTWWNVGPRDASQIHRHTIYDAQWRGLWELQKPLVNECEFAIFAGYFKAGDTFEKWHLRNGPKIAEARRLYENKKLFFAISPHPFDARRQWRHVNGELFAQVFDWLATQELDGIVIWSFEGKGQLQDWSDEWEWTIKLRERIGENSRYQKPEAVSETQVQTTEAMDWQKEMTQYNFYDK